MQQVWSFERAIRLGVGYVGMMDEVSVYRCALTSKEIEQLSRGKLYISKPTSRFLSTIGKYSPGRFT
jgi:hypothetical protein